MIPIRRPSWHIPESRVTPEDVFLNRRAMLTGLGAAAAAAALPLRPAQAAEAGAPFRPMPQTNPAYADAGRPPTPEALNTSYNNFYEFGSHKKIARDAQEMTTDPWRVTLDGLCANPQEIGLEDLLRRMPVEERIYRHRCVEAWSMVAPWIGFPLAELVKLAEPKSDARYVRFETRIDEDAMESVRRQRYYPWPYVEGVTIEEAKNPLPFMVVGAYGKVLHKPFGAAMRLHLPWKYGFKSIKSVNRISFVKERPVGFWEELQSSEYGFWANVNPEVPHRRWSQASEEVLGTGDEVPTQLFNGYAEEVAHLYKDMDRSGRTLWF